MSSGNNPSGGHSSRGKSSTDNDLAQRSMLATISNLAISKWSLGVAILAIIVAILIGAISCGGNSPTQTGTVSGTGNQQNQNQGGNQAVQSGTSCGQVGNGSNCTVEISGGIAQLSQSSPTDQEFKEKLAQTAKDKPEGAGPWPFVVVDTGPEGLFVRSTNLMQADRLGYMLNRDVAWVICQKPSSFTPLKPINDVGPKWYKIRWKINEPTLQRSTSDPGDKGSGWVYAGLVAPYGHNGDVPTCSG